MTEQPRNWDKELADIDQVIGKQGTAPPGGAPRPSRPPARRRPLREWLPSSSPRPRAGRWR